MKIVISESQYKNLVLEYYDSEQLYSRDYVVNRLKNGPKELKKYIKNLPSLEYQDNEGNIKIFTKIPEVVYVYLSGNY
jgi:hypothetical protein